MINLTQLRHDVKLAKSAGYPIDVTASQVLALINTAEAAPAFVACAMPLFKAHSQMRSPAVDRFPETLNHYTTTP
jgi:hypothetical protein